MGVAGDQPRLFALFEPERPITVEFHLVNPVAGNLRQDGRTFLVEPSGLNNRSGQSCLLNEINRLPNRQEGESGRIAQDSGGRGTLSSQRGAICNPRLKTLL